MKLARLALPAAAAVTAWFGMQAVHELGHVIGAWATRADVQNVNLHPLEFSRTDLGANPHPLLVVWAGPLLGVLLPLALWGTAAALRLKHAFLLRFFAGFCLLANGAYIGVGSLARVGDCREMLLHGSPIWVLWIFGLAAFGSGIMVLHGLGVPFGIASADSSPPRGSLAVCLVALCALLLLGVAVGSQWSSAPHCPHPCTAPPAPLAFPPCIWLGHPRWSWPSRVLARVWRARSVRAQGFPMHWC